MACARLSICICDLIKELLDCAVVYFASNLPSGTRWPYISKPDRCLRSSARWASVTLGGSRFEFDVCFSVLVVFACAIAVFETEMQQERAKHAGLHTGRQRLAVFRLSAGSTCSPASSTLLWAVTVVCAGSMTQGRVANQERYWAVHRSWDRCTAAQDAAWSRVWPARCLQRSSLGAGPSGPGRSRYSQTVDLLHQLHARTQGIPVKTTRRQKTGNCLGAANAGIERCCRRRELERRGSSRAGSRVRDPAH